MQNKIDILKEHFGSYEKVAQELEITSRHLLNVRKGQHCGKHLIKLINQLVAKIMEK